MSQSLGFPMETPGATMCINITILDDDVFEPLVPEFFSVDIDFPGFPRVLVDPQSTRVNIRDNEGKKMDEYSAYQISLIRMHSF